MKVEVLRGQDEIGLFIFFACPKKTNQKKRHPVSLVPPQAGFPALLDAAGALQTRCAQTVQIPFSAASPVLGCVPMGGFFFPPPPICPPPPPRRGGKKRGNCLR